MSVAPHLASTPRSTPFFFSFHEVQRAFSPPSCRRTRMSLSDRLLPYRIDSPHSLPSLHCCFFMLTSRYLGPILYAAHPTGPRYSRRLFFCSPNFLSDKFVPASADPAHPPLSKSFGTVVLTRSKINGPRKKGGYIHEDDRHAPLCYS